MYYINKKLAGVELNCIVVEKEFHIVVYAVNKFRHFIIGYPMYIHIDHSIIRYLMNKYDVNSRVIRWLLLVQEFDISILDKLGKHNVVAIFLSRLNHDADKDLVNDAFPDENIFSISFQIPWFVDIENYLK